MVNQFFHTEDETARLLSISNKTLQRWRVIGYGPTYHKFSGAIRYSDKDLNDFIAASQRRSTSDMGML